MNPALYSVYTSRKADQATSLEQSRALTAQWDIQVANNPVNAMYQQPFQLLDRVYPGEMNPGLATDPKLTELIALQRGIVYPKSFSVADQISQQERTLKSMEGSKFSASQSSALVTAAAPSYVSNKKTCAPVYDYGISQQFGNTDALQTWGHPLTGVREQERNMVDASKVDAHNAKQYVDNFMSRFGPVKFY